MATQVDLRQLAVERPDPAARKIVRKRSWLTRWVIPTAIIVGFLGVAGWSARERWLPAKSVTVTPVILARAESQTAGTPLFQAAGWIEPRPTPIMVSALVEGVVEKLLVTEGQEVASGQPLAKLYDADVRLALREAETTEQLRQAELDSALATLKGAEVNLDQPVHLQAAHAEAEAALAKLKTEIKNLPFVIRAAQARLQLARQDLEGKKSVADSIAGRAIQKAQSEFDAATAIFEELREREPSLQAELKAWQRKCDALHSKLELKTDETRGLGEAQANVAVARARLAQANLAVESAKLKLQRMTISSPINGRVLALNAQPGRRLMGINAASERDAATVVTLYDPKQLQVRADVRLEDVGQVQPGQPVQITTAASGKPLQGKVLALTSSADIQKNTLQVKVSIDEPPAVIKPEMLVQVVFLAPQRPESESKKGQDPLRLLIPREVVEKNENGAVVWVADASAGAAHRKVVTLGQAGTNELVEVTQGLSALDKIIVGGREGLTDGVRIRVTGEDQTLGLSAATNVSPVSDQKAAADSSMIKK